MKVDLNVDIAEGFPYDEALLDFATSANICLGVHAGNRELTLRTIERCKRKGVRIGLHPGFNDRATMGRGRVDEDQLESFAENLISQCQAFLDDGHGFAYVKPHGELYRWLTADYPGQEFPCHPALRPFLDWACCEIKLPMMLLPCPLADHIPTIREGFADRAYGPDGRLVPRSEPGAVHSSQEMIVKQALALVGKVDSICLHGDGEHCVEHAAATVKAMREHHIEVRA
ncbi:MAG: LamB/YcsF family protein [Armatimonadetes bacterium]|nr:LamB/YcsF family protein [Armatimonadota bacterium]